MRITLETAERGAFAGGASFGEAGPYERLAGKIRLAVDPKAAQNRVIVDLDKAPHSSDGLVECVADFTILKPVDMARSNHRLFYDWGNRGNIRCLQFFNDAPHTNTPRDAAHAGNGFLFRRGYTVVWIAWEGDLLPGDGRFVLDTPVATESGQPITGRVRVEYVLDEVAKSLPLSGRASTRSFPTVSLDTSKASLTVRPYPGEPRIQIDPSRWQFARLEGGSGLDGQGGETGVAPSDQHIYFKEGFQPGLIYELAYTARDPRVHGLGHAMVRDAIAFLRNDASDKNPLKGGIEKAYCWGRSQTGRAIRDYVYLGFNDDGQGRKVFDGVLPHVAGAGKQWFNHRFSLPVVPAGQQQEDHDNIADRFPFSYAQSTDHNTGKEDAILKRPKTDPLVIHTQTSTEYWQRRGSLVHTDTAGNDLKQPDNVRVFLWASSQHMSDPNLKTPSRGVCQNYVNIILTTPLFRAMLDALDRWASDGTPPPDSRMPKRSDGTLVAMEEWRKQFPQIPGVMRPSGPAELKLFDFGPDTDAGILVEPPRVLDNQSYAILVPACDADGNDKGGVRMPAVDAPLGTYTGWNLRARGGGYGSSHTFTGSYIPLPETDAERSFTNDPRPSILSRYKDKAGYVRAIEAAAKALVAERLMLEEDIARVVHAARDWGRPRHDVKTLT